MRTREGVGFAELGREVTVRAVSIPGVFFQHDPDLAFVTLTGGAQLHESASETRSRWKTAYDLYFPGEASVWRLINWEPTPKPAASVDSKPPASTTGLPWGVRR
jgi:hypothetical protein